MYFVVCDSETNFVVCVTISFISGFTFYLRVAIYTSLAFLVVFLCLLVVYTFTVYVHREIEAHTMSETVYFAHFTELYLHCFVKFSEVCEVNSF